MLSASILCLFVSPQKFYLLAFLGLGFPLLVALNLVFFIYWIFLFRLQAFFSGGILFLSCFLFPRLMQFNLHSEKSDNIETLIKELKLMSYNVRLFDLYNWTNNKKTRDRIIQFVQKQELDVVSFQEFYADDKNFFLNVDSLQDKLGMPYHNIHYTTTLRKYEHWGIATFSAYPIVSKGFIKFETKGNNACIYSDILKGKDTIRVYNIHFQSIHFKDEDYKFIDSLNHNQEVDEVKGIRKILGKLKRAFVKRSTQVDMVIEHIKTSPYKIVVCGDFNDTPISYTYQQFASMLEDSFSEAGYGIGATNNEILPQRIDYIFHDKQLKVSIFKTMKANMSDHYPIQATVSF
jgi:endonuclease/exonuclease/phosphatase family metal-dependent hydrolase